MWYYKRSNPRWVLWLTSLSFMVIIAWMYFSTIQLVVRAQGKIVPSGQNKVVQHLEGGIVAEILIAEGDVVDQGQVLFRIKNEAVKADLRELEISKQAFEAKSYRLQALINNETQLVFPKQFNASEIIKRAEQRLFENALDDFVQEQNVLNSSYERHKNKVKELQNQKANLSKEIDLALKDLQINQTLQTKGAASQKDVLDSQKRLQSIKTNFDRINLSIPTAKSEQQEALSKLRKSRSNFQLRLREELNKVTLNIQRLDAKLTASSDVEQRSDVLSSVRGIVNKLLVNTIGGIIQPGESLASITPQDENLIVEAKVKEADRGEIWLGQEARVKFRAYDFSRFGSLTGKIAFISPDSSNDQRNPNHYFYRVNIIVNQQQLAEDKPILPGMLTDVDLLADSKSILSIILGPIMKSWNRALTDQ